MAEATNTTTLNEKDFSFRFKRLPHYKSIQVNAHQLRTSIAHAVHSVLKEYSHTKNQKKDSNPSYATAAHKSLTNIATV